MSFAVKVFEAFDNRDIDAMSQPPRTVPVYFGKGSEETWLESAILMKLC